MTYLALFIFLFWLVKGFDLIFGVLFGVPFLKDVPPCETNGAARLPKISIIFGARDEAQHIGPAVESMLNQDYPDFEVIAVNDRSRDETPKILERLAAKYPSRLKIITLTSLPENWIGKSHALYQGYRAASGDFLLFTDADVTFSPLALRRSVTAMKKWKLDHLTLFPGLEGHGFKEGLFMNGFTILFNLRFRPWAAQQKHSLAYIGIGSFNLIRRPAYEKAGTHESIALEVADDLRLGKLIKRRGFRQMIMEGRGVIFEKWVEGFRSAVGLLEKNAFAGLDYSMTTLITGSLALLVFEILPFIGVFIFPSPASYYFAGVIAIIFLMHCAGQRAYSMSLAVFPFHPLSILFMLFIVWRSAWLTLKNQGIRWRDTFYSLKTLREARKI